jgi:2-iminobutanoate/2-iminopropanoate deaminase
MGPVDPDTGEIVRGDLAEQMRIAVGNIRLVLEAAGSGLEKVLKTTVYLADMDDFARMNELYSGLFGPVYPARTTIQAGRLPLDIRIEIEVVASR